MINRHIITVFSLSMAMAAQAQLYDHNLDVTLGGGLQSIQYSPKNGDHTPLFGGAFNINYRYMLDDHWGVGAGVGLGFYNAKATFDNLELRRDLIHRDNNEPYEHRTFFHDWEEKQRLLEVEVPIAFYYTTPIKKGWEFIGSIGAKLNFPVWNQYKNTDGYMETKGFFEELTNIEYQNLPQHQFLTLQGYKGEMDLKKLAVSPFIDAGVIHNLKNDIRLYLGAYFSYGVTSLIEKGKAPLFDSEKYTNVINSDQTNKAHLLACGLKVGVTFGFPKIYPLPAMQHELEMDEEFAEDKYAEIVKAEELEREAELKAIEELKRQEEERKAQELENAKKVVTWLNKNIKVNFELNQAIVETNDEIRSYVNDLVKYIKENPDKIVTIYGHTCNLGKEEKNIVLGKRRADAMKEVLVNAGCPEENVKAASKGSSEPLVPNTSEANRKKNRRIEIQIN